MAAKPRVVVLGEKPQGATWLKMALESDRFDIVAGVPRYDPAGQWWDGECFRDVLVANGIPVVRRAELHAVEYDILWSMMYGFIIEPELIGRARIGLNLHESPLPRYRGCNGYSHAILERDASWGTTFHTLGAELDSGELIDQETFPIEPAETVRELYQRTIAISNHLFRRNLVGAAALAPTRSGLDVASEPVRPRRSLDALKPIDEPDRPVGDWLFRHVRGFDFVPFEPAFADLPGGRVHLFVDGAWGRLHHGPELARVAARGSLASLCHGREAVLIDGFDRPLVAMAEAAYARIYPLFRRAPAVPAPLDAAR